MRISKHKKTLGKVFTPSYANEVFTVHSVQTSTVPVTHLLNDYIGIVLKAGVYEHEISKSHVGDVYLVEKVLQRKGDRLLLHWFGFDGNDDTRIRKKT